MLIRELSDTEKCNYSVDQLIKDIIPDILRQWRKANALFSGPVINSDIRLFTKLKALWEKARKVSLGQAKLKEKQSFMEKLDKLLDILTCHCKITSCLELGCSPDCIMEVHIDCKCSREQKIPVIELAFIKG